ncbi:MAG: DUF4412 domain-containing protein [bacterium]
MNSSSTLKLIVLTTLLILTARALVAQQIAASFEGEIIFKIQDTEQVALFTCLVKGDRLRIGSVDEMSSSPLYYVDLALNKVYAVNSARERIAEYSLNPPGVDPSSIKLEKKEETEEIAEISCIQYSLKTKSGDVELWAAKALGSLGGFHLAMSSKGFTFTPWEVKLLSMSATALRSIERDSNGYEVLRFEVVRVVERRINEILLKVPGSFEKVEFNRLIKR